MARLTIAMNFTLKVIRENKVVQTVRTHSKRRFLNSLRTINWGDEGIKACLRVSYGKQKDVWDKMATFYNDGFYEKKEEFWQAFKAFKE